MGRQEEERWRRAARRRIRETLALRRAVAVVQESVRAEERRRAA